MVDIEILDYREDKIVNGVLCFALNGEWVEYSKAELTEMFLNEQNVFSSYVDRVIDSQCQ